MAKLDRIVDVQIALNTAGISKLGFSTMLIAGRNTVMLDRVATVTSIDDMLEMGFAVDSEMYKAAQAAFSQTPRPRQVKLGRLYSNEAIAIGMTAIKAVDNDFYGVILASHEKQDVLDMAAYVETQTMLFGTSTDEAGAYAQASTDDVLSQLKNNEYYRTFCDVRKDASDYEESAKMARCFAIDPGGETWALKSLASVKTDGWTETEYTTIKNKNGNTYEKVRNISVTQNGKVVAGEWIDIIRFRDWLVEEIQTNVFTLLKNNDKVPYTDAGIAMVENVVRKALEDGQDRGGIAPTEYDENNNENPGFVLTVPLASEITATQKATRDLKDIKFTARMAGAIHTVEIKGSFTYENLITTDNVMA